jgi:hypothetical protein
MEASSHFPVRVKAPVRFKIQLFFALGCKLMRRNADSNPALSIAASNLATRSARTECYRWLEQGFCSLAYLTMKIGIGQRFSQRGAGPFQVWKRFILPLRVLRIAVYRIAPCGRMSTWRSESTHQVDLGRHV